MSEPHSKDIIEAFKDGGWIAALIGLGGMIARLLLKPLKGMTWGKALSHSTAAAIISLLVWYVIHESTLSEPVKAVILGLSGMAAPELMDVVLQWVGIKTDKFIESEKNK